LNSKFSKNYIISKHVENFEKVFLSKKKKLVKKMETPFEIFKNILFVKMEYSN
jgi:hypothetical protein